MPKIAAEMRPWALRARSLAEERKVVHELLAKIPATHLGLLSVYGRDMIMGELIANDSPTLGFQLMRDEAGYLVSFLLEGGPAARAGLKSGDRVLTLDGLPPERSARLDWRTDDAYLDDRRDPPMHAIIVKLGERVGIEIERSPGRRLKIEIASEPYSAWRGTEASIRTYEQGRLKIGYLHLWYVYRNGIPGLLTRTLTTRFADHAALVLDLRGRGGSALVLPEIVDLFEGANALWPRPVVALVDRQTRSGKEVLAYDMKTRGIARLVGEPTAGAVIPATFADVGNDSVLMFPSFTMPTYTKALELKPTQPDVSVERAGIYAAGADPILQRGIAEAESMAKATQFKALNFPKIAVGSLPAWPQLRTRMIDALGGEVALRRHRTLIVKGTCEIVNTPIKGTYQMAANSPDSYIGIADLPQVGRTETSFAGGRGKVRTPGQPVQPIEGRYAAALHFQSLFFGPLQYDEAFSKIVVKGTTTFDGHSVFEVELAGSDGGVVVLFVDAASALPLGTRSLATSQFGEVEATNFFRNYRQFDGRMLATELLTSTKFQQQLVRIETVTLK